MPDASRGFFTARQVVMATGVSERCLHYWDSAGVVSPSKRGDGPGIYRGYSLEQVILVSITKRMREAGISLQRIRKAMQVIRSTVRSARNTGRTPHLVMNGQHALLVIGQDVASRQPQLIVDALQGGQLVLAIPVTSLRKTVESKLGGPEWQPRRTAQAVR